MSNPDSELFEEIKLDVYQKLNYKLSDDDPIFAIVLANQKAITYFARPIVEAVESIPGIFESSLEKIATAVEIAEATADQLISETKSNLFAISKVEIEAAHSRLKDSLAAGIDQLLAEALGRVSGEVAELERRVKSTSSQTGMKKSFILNLVLAAGLLMTIAASSSALYALYSVGAKNLSDARYWRSEYDAQRDLIDKLPPSVKKQFTK